MTMRDFNQTTGKTEVAMVTAVNVHPKGETIEAEILVIGDPLKARGAIAGVIARRVDTKIAMLRVLEVHIGTAPDPHMIGIVEITGGIIGIGMSDTIGIATCTGT